MTPHLMALGSGALFAVGLGVSGMTLPERVIGFLDVAGRWDPTLAFVMMGAIPAYALLFRMVRSHDKPVFHHEFGVPTRTDIDRRLLLGAALFGAGWGIGGLCPGPALTNLTTAIPGIAAFTAAMVVGSLLPGVVERISERRTA